MKLLTASWVLPMESPPVDGGALLVSGGRILEVGTVADLTRSWPGVLREDHDGCALVPALVNAHAHLELTGLGQPPSGRSFVDWVLEVIRRKRAASLDDYSAGILAGAQQCRETGQGLVADVLSEPAAAGAYPTGGPLAAVFPEVIAPGAESAGRALERALSVQPFPPAHRAGLSPHSPYTAGEAAYRACAAALGPGLLMTHAAESAEEVEFCRCGTGSIVDRLFSTLGLTPPARPGAHPVAWLDRLGVLGPRTLLVHCVHLEPEHPELLRRRGCGVVLCPRSNRALGVGAAPGRVLLDSGVPVGLGTDSALSAGDLDLWKDVRLALDDYGWSPQEALFAATAGGARVLDAAREWGSFAPGRRAAILRLPLGPGLDLWERILSSGPVSAAEQVSDAGPAPGLQKETR